MEGDEAILTYDIAGGTIATVITDTEGELGALALDQGVLYYLDSTPGHSGLYARTLSTRSEVLITSGPLSAVAVDNGNILWTDEQYKLAQVAGLPTLMLMVLMCTATLPS